MAITGSVGDNLLLQAYLAEFKRNVKDALRKQALEVVEPMIEEAAVQALDGLAVYLGRDFMNDCTNMVLYFRNKEGVQRKLK